MCPVCVCVRACVEAACLSISVRWRGSGEGQHLLLSLSQAEARWIFISSHELLVCAVVIVPLVYSFSDEPLLAFVLQSIGLLLVSSVCSSAHRRPHSNFLRPPLPHMCSTPSHSLWLAHMQVYCTLTISRCASPSRSAPRSALLAST